MRVKTISVTYGRKFNLDDYESLHVEETIWADIDEDDETAEACEADLWEMIKLQVKAQALPVLTARNEKRSALAKQASDATNMIGK